MGSEIKGVSCCVTTRCGVICMAWAPVVELWISVGLCPVHRGGRDLPNLCTACPPAIQVESRTMRRPRGPRSEGLRAQTRHEVFDDDPELPVGRHETFDLVARMKHRGMIAAPEFRADLLEGE